MALNAENLPLSGPISYVAGLIELCALTRRPIAARQAVRSSLRALRQSANLHDLHRQ
jgi:hypothetical protein